MIDCHIHTLLDSVDWKRAIARHTVQVDKAYVRDTVKMYAEKGYTYLRDGGDRWGVGAYARGVAKQFGIIYRTPLAPLSKKGHYGGFIGLQWENMQDFARLVRMQKAQGADFCKIMVSGLMDFDHYGVLTEEPLTRQEILELVHIAKEEGQAVMAHCNGGPAMTACAEAGVDSIEHGAYLEEETLHLLAESDAVWVPTIAPIANLRGLGRFPDAVLEPLTQLHQSNVAYAAAIGAKLALGTDAGAYAVYHGSSVQQEYDLLHEAIGPETDRVLEEGLKELQRRF